MRNQGRKSELPKEEDGPWKVRESVNAKSDHRFYARSTLLINGAPGLLPETGAAYQSNVPGALLELGGDYSSSNGFLLGGELSLISPTFSPLVPAASLTCFIGYSRRSFAVGLKAGAVVAANAIETLGQNVRSSGLVGLTFRFGQLERHHGRLSAECTVGPELTVLIPQLDLSAYLRTSPRAFVLVRARGGFSLPQLFSFTHEVGAEIIMKPGPAKDMLTVSAGWGALPALRLGALFQLGYERRW